MKKFAILIMATGATLCSCQKKITNEELALSPETVPLTAHNEERKKVYVSDLASLYEAVNNEDNSGRTVVLAPGTYVLDASYPNAGRIEFRKDMSLQGQPGNAEAVVIDATALPLSSFPIGGGVTVGAVRMGNGSNSLEWVKVIGHRNAFAAVDSDLSPGDASVAISHCLVTNGQYGIVIRNRRAEHAGRTITAQISNNELTGNTAGFGYGVGFLNNNSATGSRISATLTGNYAHGNRIGLSAGNNAGASSIENASIHVVSRGDRFEGNGTGIFVTGATSQGATLFGNDNRVQLEMHGASIQHNNPSPMPPEIAPRNGVPTAGIFVAGGGSTVANETTSRNQVRADFWGTTLDNNNGTDVYAFGAYARLPTTFAGYSNSVILSFQGVSAKASVAAAHAFPAEPAGDNNVSIIK